MGKWLAAFRAEGTDDPAHSGRAVSANSADSPAGENEAGPIGTYGAIGRGQEGESEGRRPELLAQTALLARGDEGRNAHVRDEQDMRDDYEERAAILEFDAHLPRAEAERRAWDEVFGPNAITWTPDPTRRVSQTLTDEQVDEMLRCWRERHPNR